MPYTKNDYPVSMKNLDPAIRHKAIDILNTLLDKENMEEGTNRWVLRGGNDAKEVNDKET